MADIFDSLAGLTLNTKEATEDSDLIKVNAYLNPEVSRVHGTQLGIIMDQYIPILGQFEDIGKLDPGSCGVNTVTDNFPVSEKTWTPKLISARIPICADDIPQKLKFWMEKNIASGRWDNINDALKQFVLDRASEAQARAIIRISEFADTAAAVVGSGGYLTAGTTAALFTMLDGMWKQIFIYQATSPTDQFRYEIAENSEASKQAQKTLAEERAYECFSALTEGLAPEAMSGNNVLMITKTLWDNWVRYLEKKGGAFKIELLQDGITKETFRGFPIIVRSDWDRLIKKYHDLGDTYYLPHRVLLTDINNIPIGTSDTESFSKIEAFYVQKDKTHYTDMAWRQDCKVLQEENLAVAY